MKKLFAMLVTISALTLANALAQEEINVEKSAWNLGEKPLPIALSGFSGEADQVLRFDLEVMGFKIVPPEAAQYLLSGSSNGKVEGRLLLAANKSQILGKAYSGGSIRQQAHALADDVVRAARGSKGIAQTRIGFKVDTGKSSEVAISDFDGFGAQTVTSDSSIVAAPVWVPGRSALFYTSYKLGTPNIFHHNLASGERHAVARYPGLNTSPAPSPDGRKVAMILSKDGWTDVYVSNTDGSDLLRLTRSREDESSPCWSPDGKWICFAGKVGERRGLYKVPAGGGEIQRISTSGVSSPSEPDWSPDGKWIAFTAQRGGGFDICVVPAGGGTVTLLVEGEDPSWASNSRNLVYARRVGSGRVLSLLDVPTKQFKDVRRVSGSASQPAWAK